MIKCDFHIHTFASHDSITKPEQIQSICNKKNITTIAITDHNQIQGAYVVRDALKNINVVIGEEVQTLQGDVIGLFIKDKIESEHGLLETVQAIKAQNGLVYLPHPFDTSTGKRNAVSPEEAQKVIDYIDIIEIFNARTFDNKFNQMAKEFATKHGKIMLAGSDAHFFYEIGNAGFEIEEFTNSAEFLTNAKKANTFGKKTNPAFYVGTKFVRLIKKYGK